MKFIPEWESISQHQIPQWFHDAKIGIFIHWGAYSVPAWALPTCQLGDIPTDEGWFCNNPYAEWYQNSVRVGRGPTYEYHCKTYGKDYPYENFVDLWTAEKFQPETWAQLFFDAGARYVIPTSKHHDGLCLWDSAYTDFNTAKRGPKRDLLKDLSNAVRDKGMRFGVYYSGIIDWRYSKSPIYCSYDLHHPENVTYAYADYAYNQMIELIDQYQPSVLWNDIGWPYKGEADLPYLLSYYYNHVSDGVVNNRWNGLWCDYKNREYNSIETGDCSKWENCRGLGLSFGYNQVEDDSHLLAPNDLISLLIRTIAANGNLLINVGPKADGTIPENQVSRLLYMGDWLKKNGEGIYATRLYEREHDILDTGETIYYTRKEQNLYLFVDHPKAGNSQLLIKGMGQIADSIHAIGDWIAHAENSNGNLILTTTRIPENSPAVMAVARL